MFSTIRNPLLALILGLLPFVVFVGASSSTRINGQTVSEENINVLGLALAAAGFVIVVRFLRAKSPRTTLSLILSGLAILVCAAQIPASLGLYSPKRLFAALQADSDLPTLTYKELDAGNRRIPEGILAKNDPAETRRQIIGYKASALYDGSTHLAYADRCHNGRRRIDVKTFEALPDFITNAERNTLATEVANGRKRGEALPCNDANTRHAMGELVDRVNRLQDFVSILLAGYHAQTKK